MTNQSNGPNRWRVNFILLDSVAGHIRSGVSSGNILTLKLTSASDAKTVTYLVDKTWDHKTLLYGSNGIAALTFCEVLIEPQ